MEHSPVMYQSSEISGVCLPSSPAEIGAVACDRLHFPVKESCQAHPATSSSVGADHSSATGIAVASIYGLFSQSPDIMVFPGENGTCSQKCALVQELYTGLEAEGQRGSENHHSKVMLDSSCGPSNITTDEPHSSSQNVQESTGTEGANAEDIDEMLDVLSYSYEDLIAPIHDVSLSGDMSWDSYNQACSGFSEMPAAQLCIPDDNLAELDWISEYVHGDLLRSEAPLKSKYKQSHVDQSHGEVGTGFSRSARDGSPTSISDQSFIHLQNGEVLEGDVAFPIRARSKRSRGISRAWSSSNLLSDLENINEGAQKRIRRVHSYTAKVPAISPISSPSVSEDGNGIVPDYYAMDRSDCSGGENDSQSKHSVKKVTGHGSEASTVRRCSHCETTKTPQWRAGPHGPKTLCNACGVRYKSGRLLPEYRPAGSPGYVGNKHSNSHRKIMEMRRKKEEGVVISEQEQSSLYSSLGPSANMLEYQ